ncbi:MAG: MFS transporter [Myxococcales bacterium]|nr:MFS transporter [Myxococcales bacterium]
MAAADSLRMVGAALRDRNLLLLLALGFASGLPYALRGETLQAWLKGSGVDVATIGMLTWVGLPYSFKFVWAPLFDRFQLPWLGRRRGWIAASQVAAGLAIAGMGLASPSQALAALTGLAVLVAFASASQDIVSDGYRADLLHGKSLATGTATFLLGYRIAMLVASSGALLLADALMKGGGLERDAAWRWVYLAMAGLLVVGLVAAVLAPEPEQERPPPTSLAAAVVQPFVAFARRWGWREAMMALAFVSIFRLSDRLLLTTPFYLELGFSNTDLATFRKIIGTVATIIGFGVGGTLVAKAGIRRGLWVGTVAIAVSNLGFAALAMVGKSYLVFGLAVGLDSLCNGIADTAFIAFLLGLCEQRYSATQYALLSSAAASVGTVVGGFSGFLIQSLGWTQFFVATVLAGIPAVLLLWRLPRSLFTAVDGPPETTPTASHL